MELSITGRHIEVTSGLKEYVHKKAEKLKHHFEHIIRSHVILEVDKLIHRAEVQVLSDEKTFFCEVATEDMYESIDRLFDRMERQIRRYKERFSHKKVRSISKNIQEVLQNSKRNTLQITKVKQVMPKPRTKHEAVLQLSLNEHRFEIFHQERNGKREESLALQKEDESFVLIESQEEQPNSWIQKKVFLEGDKGEKLIEGKATPYSVESMDLKKAMKNLMGDSEKEYIFFSDAGHLQVLYVRRNHSLGLLTTGEI